mmetsp:Transcript_54255/g.86256  ORF Transcript_54255/g.86256 Transcript_54255/m.86256 type:complete len:201 (-) Transcript_54255:449-1051(-)
MPDFLSRLLLAHHHAKLRGSGILLAILLRQLWHGPQSQLTNATLSEGTAKQGKWLPSILSQDTNLSFLILVLYLLQTALGSHAYGVPGGMHEAAVMTKDAIMHVEFCQGLRKIAISFLLYLLQPLAILVQVLPSHILHESHLPYVGRIFDDRHDLRQHRIRRKLLRGKGKACHLPGRHRFYSDVHPLVHIGVTQDELQTA